ncbi:uncharacterized protein AB675_8427 [Cyphellophora attinorum]|uniref:Uncharacterized protein n=1 Tax=Cyphellophora attinorum TaxID=1664694 RepID=A0A0N1H9P8_9EURO|nr:uncharacterized protein AB675_8427 [Phialophora attinorum]KPI44450.1 hypothetical protein AB675_8427 [Phialophora attinorum]
MAANSSNALKHWARIIQRWPVDKVRPEPVSFQTIMRRRVERLTNPVLATEAGKTPSSEAPVETQPPPTLNEQKEMGQVNALYSLLENRYATAYPMPETMRYPASRKTHYDDLLKELELRDRGADGSHSCNGLRVGSV